MLDVIVLGDSYSMSLGIIRALGKHGYGVRLLKKADNLHGNKNPEELSKYVIKSLRVTSEKQSIMNGLNQMYDPDNKLLIIPGDDASALFLDNNAQDLTDRFHIPSLHNKNGSLKILMDKLEQKKLAQACGLPVAKGACYETSESGRKEAKESVEYPCFIKPLVSAGISKDIIGTCESVEDLMSKMEKAESEGCSRVLVEKKLDIEHEFVCNGVAFGNKVYLPACINVKRRGLGRRKGVTAEGTVLNSRALGDMESKLENFVMQTGLTGLFDIELMKCHDDIYFCEMNFRNGATGYAVTLAGANLPGILADYIYKGIVPSDVYVKKKITFVSEKVELDCFVDGNISFLQYRKHLGRDKARLIKDFDDPKPYRIFISLFFLYSLRKIKRFFVNNLLSIKKGNGYE